MKVIENLQNREGNYILPFFWQHGESEEVLRTYMNAIRNANITEVCLEARPHPDYAGEQWFHDLDIIIDEAKKLGMKIWILDDAHFPSGQAAGKMADAPNRLCKTYLNYHSADICGPVRQATLDVAVTAKYYKNPFAATHPFFTPEKREFDDDRLFAVIACRLDGKFGNGYHLDENLIDLTDLVQDGQLVWDVPDGNYRIMVIYETHQGGGRGGYVNFLSKESCRIQIDACYEPHYARYKEEFGKTILGFFSDEPEIGNTMSYNGNSGKIGNHEMPLPWSEEMPALMEARFGADYRLVIPALWFPVGSDAFTADKRTGYMDIVSRQCQRNFGEQIGEWCREHGVKYIGHIVEDMDASPNLAASQGHFFRALWGQDWSGIDNIGGQITVGGANKSHGGFIGLNDGGEFYHHALGKMGTSLADIDPKKHGNTMCETFGAYGWEEGTRLMKYEADHLLVRGINRFVPHAFSPKEFPDFDCPPHFYAHGKNPLYKPFGTLMNYMNRVANLISDGMHKVEVAILYHAESEWSGQDFMDMVKPARFLDDEQIDFDFIPADVFKAPEMFDSSFDAEGLHINGHLFKALIIPGAAYVDGAVMEFVRKAKETDFAIIFAGRTPEGCSEEFAATELSELGEKLDIAGICGAKIMPKSADIEIYHYMHAEEDYYLVNNESADHTFVGEVILLGADIRNVYRYDAFTNKTYALTADKEEDACRIPVEIAPYEMLIIVAPKSEQANSLLASGVSAEPVLSEKAPGEIGGEWTVSFCLNEDYPNFSDEQNLSELRNINLLKPDFSGVIRYENTVDIAGDEQGRWNRLEVEDAYESVELWVNGQYAGERICPPYRFDTAELLQAGKNEIRLEVRTTLDRLVHKITGGQSLFGPEMKAVYPSGIIGKVTLR